MPREQGGQWLFDQVEELRQAAIAMRASGRDDYSADVLAAVALLEVQKATDVARAFAMYFHLINVAEELQRLRRLREHAIDSYRKRRGVVGGDHSRPREGGASHRDLQDVLNRLLINPVLTAHPSEVRRRSIISHLIKIRGDLSTLHGAGLAPWEEQAANDALLREITALWQTDDVRPLPPTPLNEVQHGLYYLARAIFSVVPALHRDLEHALAQSYPDATPPGTGFLPLQFGSWIGGDRDGNPSVTAAVTDETFGHRGARCLSSTTWIWVVCWKHSANQHTECTSRLS